MTCIVYMNDFAFTYSFVSLSSSLSRCATHRNALASPDHRLICPGQSGFCPFHSTKKDFKRADLMFRGVLCRRCVGFRKQVSEA